MYARTRSSYATAWQYCVLRRLALMLLVLATATLAMGLEQMAAGGLVGARLAEHAQPTLTYQLTPGTSTFYSERNGASSLASTLCQLNTVGSEFRVNTTTASSQDFPAVAMDANGSFVVAWSTGDIFAQRYDAIGVAQGLEFLVNTYTSGSQLSPAVGMAANGDFVIAWDGRDQDGSYDGIFAQRYNAAGEPQGNEFQVNTYSADNQMYPALAMNAAGNFVVVWASQGQDGANYGIYGQRYNAVGVPQGAEFRANTYTTDTQTYPAVAINAAGDFVVAWTSTGQDGSGEGVYAQRYNSVGVAQGAEFLVNTYTTGSQALPSLAMDTTGNFIVTWVSFAQDGFSGGIYAQRYSAAGARLGSEFRVNTTTTYRQSEPQVTMGGTGNFVITWYSEVLDGSGNGVYAQAYDAPDVAQGTEVRVNTYTNNDQDSPALAMNTTGNVAIAWASYGQDGSGDGIYAQKYLLSCTAPTPTPTPTPALLIAGLSRVGDRDGRIQRCAGRDVHRQQAGHDRRRLHGDN